MSTALRLSKTEARNKLRAYANKKIRLKRDVFFVPGWTDQACLSWTEPYIESGVDRKKGWEYTIKDWEYIIENPEKLHYIQLVENETVIKIIRNKKGKVEKVEFKIDPTYDYTNFFQFAELIKKKIRQSRAKKYDLIGYSMGGLDIIAAASIDPKEDDFSEVKDFIKTGPLENVGLLITVATPYKGSVAAHLVKHTKLDEKFMPEWSDGIRKQCDNMAFDSPFIKIINTDKVRKRLLKNTSIGVHTFGSTNDKAAAYKNTQIEGANNHKPIEQAQHSQRMGITQDPRTALEIFKLLSI